MVMNFKHDGIQTAAYRCTVSRTDQGVVVGAAFLPISELPEDTQGYRHVNLGADLGVDVVGLAGIRGRFAVRAENGTVDPPKFSEVAAMEFTFPVLTTPFDLGIDTDR